MSIVPTSTSELQSPVLLRKGGSLKLKIYKQKWDIIDEFDIFVKIRTERLVTSMQLQYKTVEIMTSRQPWKSGLITQVWGEVDGIGSNEKL